MLARSGDFAAVREGLFLSFSLFSLSLFLSFSLSLFLSLSQSRVGLGVEHRNYFLAALSREDLAALSPGLKEVVIAGQQLVSDPGRIAEFVYFPTGACFSVVTLMSDGRAVETSTIGRESAVGLLSAATAAVSTHRIFAQIGGGAVRLGADLFRARVLANPALAQLTLLHARANAVQAEQGVACNAVHDLAARLARWLLMTEDRVGAASFMLTQDYMAMMTGVQRSSVSSAASSLKRSGLIDYSRGRLTIVDRAGLQRRACECYGVVDAQFQSLRRHAELAST